MSLSRICDFTFEVMRLQHGRMGWSFPLRRHHLSNQTKDSECAAMRADFMHETSNESNASAAAELHEEQAKPKARPS
jgi:hypothetical protein